ncbi:phenylalanine--tRNA ligase subunit beta [Belliella kenyensis]|uniref:Phenylalanine--tRNA ligase beta subunit n=1 Tax=Belliella kenyensis TaxID=1472724 RepID=A0ABV8EHA5_9BACT|nr:phenylalanine--tRNA ligase subunit beta [Belliella kenyensis]MCH7403477.1 phenylalanine--tRNA ligase subunit beta [Belliella kenyensis]MDN3602377.1 phenylalanine--tRNA ligase subunit beta [Belliella kenyensis]
MKISINRLKHFIELDQTAEEIAALLTGSGLEVEGIETFESIKGGLEGVVIGEVLTCERHPNADKLSITTVDIGTAVVPIVCGAPNVAAGQKVIVATEGAMLYPLSGEPFQIKKAKIRGEVSQGMICAEDEIGIGESHAGIMVLDTDLANGAPAASYFNIESTEVLEIGLTPNRADAASHLGVARDLKALLGKDIQLPSIEHFDAPKGKTGIAVEVENTNDCPRYAGITIEGVQVAPSPEWLQNYLKALDLEPINNVVDITNFILHDLGQPLHAFDAAKIEGGKITVKKLPKGTKFTTLDEKERTLSGEELMICDQNGGLCIAGVFGGKGSGVSEETTSIFLESAYFSPDVIRKGSQFHGLKTDASFRFERGTDPNMPIYALQRAANLIKEIAGGEFASEVIDIYPNPVEDFQIEVSYKHIDRLIGKHIAPEEVKSILEGLDIQLSNESAEGFTAMVKPYRVDVTREADVIEEILRIYGFDRVSLSENLDADYLAEHPSKDLNKLQYRLSELLTGLGYFEIITNSLTKPAYVEKSTHLQESDNVVILNKLSEDLGVMRQSLLFTGLEVLAHNINRRQKDLKLFEFGSVYFKEAQGYREEKRLSLFLTGDKVAESWLAPSKPVQFPDLYTVVDLILEKMGIDNVNVSIVHESPYDYALQLMIGTKELGSVGMLSASSAKLAEVKQEVLFAELNWDLICKKSKGLKKYQEISKFPEVRRDLSLVIDKTITFDQVKTVALKAGGKLLQRIGVFDVYQGDKIESSKKAYALSFYLQDTEQTLTDKVIDKTMNRLIQTFENEVGAMIRK